MVTLDARHALASGWWGGLTFTEQIALWLLKILCNAGSALLGTINLFWLNWDPFIFCQWCKSLTEAWVNWHRRFDLLEQYLRVSYKLVPRGVSRSSSPIIWFCPIIANGRCEGNRRRSADDLSERLWWSQPEKSQWEQREQINLRNPKKCTWWNLVVGFGEWGKHQGQDLGFLFERLGRWWSSY